MAHIRIRPNGRIQFDLHLFGKRFREGTKMMATPKNVAKAKTLLKKMNAEIDLGTFEYRHYFPSSKKVYTFEALQRAKCPDRLYPFFDDYANAWFERQLSKWKSSYKSTVRNNLDRYLIPEFGNILLGEITLAQVEVFRQRLTEELKPDGSRRLSNNRINNVLGPLVSILSLAADEFKFDYPLRRYRMLKEQKGDSNPMTIEEVQRFLKTVDDEWRDYFILRFWTGMRSCEVHGLRWEDVDFGHRIIRIRHNYVNGELGMVKTPKSKRNLKMCDTLLAVFSRLKAEHCQPTEFVFTNARGMPLDTHWVSKRVWYSTLKKAGLSKRRAYETRHTAAVLHIAAHENPAYISQMLGHNNMRLLFDIYAPYVANASGSDGHAFEQMMGKPLA
ncbi:site-specific integrase [Vibrio breoganii]|uniref:site-specific integrase n=1 Tax=Vibrio breoganii TaxID=553239 RepID=UPI000C861CBE|nr:site-specific integrase [Vibrio breoganii]PML92256.1 integrase [Vibrio breoganii]PMN57794.1 integrase [Vibrio breoganii]